MATEALYNHYHTPQSIMSPQESNKFNLTCFCVGTVECLYSIVIFIMKSTDISSSRSKIQVIKFCKFISQFLSLLL